MCPIFKLYSFLEVALSVEGFDSLVDHPLQEWELIFVDLCTLHFSALTRLNDFRKESYAQQKGSGSLAQLIKPGSQDLRMSLFGDEDMSKLSEMVKMQKAISKFSSRRNFSRRPSDPSRSFNPGRQSFRSFGEGGGFQDRKRFSGSRGGKGGARRSPPAHKQN